MLKFITNFFKEPPDIEQIQDKNVVNNMYKHWSFRIFYSTFVAYIITHLCRKNIAVALPYIGSDLGYTNTQLGILGASLYMTYGVGKFINGIFADRSNLRTFLPTALTLSAIANICFVLSTLFITPGHVSFFGLPSATILLWVLTFLWGANGWFQSMVFPAIAKGLSHWLSKSERGTKWSIWSTSHQFGVFATIMLSGFLISHFGWKASFIVPSLICIITSIWLYNRLRDTPQSLGLPDIDIYKGEIIEDKDFIEPEKKMSYFEIFKKYIVFNKIIWLLSFAYAFVYVIRFGTEDWLIKYLIEYKHNSLSMATQKLSSLAVVGALGAISAGFLSDKIYQGRRIPINIVFFICLALSLLAFHFNPPERHYMDFIYAAMIGMFTAGPQLLLGGICALEASSKQVASATLGFAGMFGYVGAVMSAYGTGFVIDRYGWTGAVYFWTASAIIGVILCFIIMFYNHHKCLQKQRLQAQKSPKELEPVSK